MYINKITKGKIKRNFLIMMYGVEGCGKSTFGSNCPKPIFLCAESGTDHLEVARLPGPDGKTPYWMQIREMLNELLTENHQYKTLVVDTVDWLESYLHEYLLKRDKPKDNSINNLAGGYGNHVVYINNEWRKLFDILDKLRSKMNILLLSHSHVKGFNDPQENAEYQRYELKFHIPKSASLMKEYVDALFFVNYDVAVKEEQGKRLVKAFGDGSRIVYTERRPAFDAKNRYGMPAELPLDINSGYNDLSKFIFVDDDELLKNILTEINNIIVDIEDKEKLKKITSFVEANKTNINALKSALLRLKG